MPVLEASRLSSLVAAIFEAVGTPASAAATVSESLVEAELAGHDSHGLIRVAEYLKEIREGRLDPRAEPLATDETETTIQVFGHGGFGQVTAVWATRRLIEKARKNHVAVATVAGCGHVGRLGTYAEMAAAQNLICFAFANGGGMQPRVAPFGGAEAKFGTNPLAAAVPIPGDGPIVIDLSTAVVASGKIRVLRDQGLDLPEGWILDRNGNPSRSAKDYYDGGMLLPAAGHKGYGLSLLVEVLAGILTGAGTLLVANSGYRGGNGVVLIAIDVATFRPLEQFGQQITELARTVKDTPPVAGGGEVMLPGEPERRSRERNLREGLHVADITWKAVQDAARDLGIRA